MNSPEIVHARNAPEWMLVPYVDDGYRIRHSVKDTVKSLFYFHGETLNVWSHLLGFLWFLSIIPTTLATLNKNDDATKLEYAAFACFISCGLFQMASSAVYHLFLCVNENVANILLIIDLAGIAAMIVGCLLIASILGMTDAPFVALFYLTLQLCLLSVALSKAVASQSLETYHTIVASSFALGVVQCCHMLRLQNSQCSQIFAPGVYETFLYYVVGFAFYKSRFPECIMPSVIKSHTIWHAFILLGGRSWTLTMLLMLNC